MSSPLRGAVALVTGASRGLGAATAIELARLGAHVVITGRVQGGLEETDDAIRALGGGATLLPLDLAEGGQVDVLGPSIHERFGRLDILVHCAAGYRSAAGSSIIREALPGAVVYDLGERITTF
jgi:NAD(P)-dependent dehydrogenase (short-subunit alcohol dehydrogenase family)